MPLERDINIAVNGPFLVHNLHQVGPFVAMLISRSRGTYLILTIDLTTHRSLDERWSVELAGWVLLAVAGGVDLVPRERLPLRLGGATTLAVRRGPEIIRAIYLID